LIKYIYNCIIHFICNLQNNVIILLTLKLALHHVELLASNGVALAIKKSAWKLCFFRTLVVTEVIVLRSRIQTHTCNVHGSAPDITAADSWFTSPYKE
jgi:hypothetical protein